MTDVSRQTVPSPDASSPGSASTAAAPGAVASVQPATSRGSARQRRRTRRLLIGAVPLVGVLTRLVRSGLLDVLDEDYIRTARAKGLTPRTVMWRHAIRNMLIPVITVVGLQIGTLLGGAVITETVFAWPGVGLLLIDAITNRDYPLVQAAILFITATFITINFLVDLSYGLLDPRIRLQ